MILSLLMLLAQAAPDAVNAAPTWIKPAEPTGRTIFADFIGLPGKVTLDCHLPTYGIPEDCRVISAVPEGAGYERVAVGGASTGLLSPKLVDGRPTPTRVQLIMTFPAAPDFPPYTGPEPSEEAIALARPIAKERVRLQASGRIVADVAPDRQVLVQSWLDELLPPDPEAEIEQMSLQLARVLSLEQMRNINAGRPPGGVLPDFRTLNGAQFPDPKLIKAADELRRRYCAAYDCRDPTAPDQ